MKYIKLFDSYVQKTEFWGSVGAGVLPVCVSTGRVLVGLRSSYVNEPNTWGIFGGKLDTEEGLDETIEEAAMRELTEELRYYGDIELVKAFVFRKGETFTYHNFFGIVGEEFKPRLDWENSDAKWITIQELIDLPRKHFGLVALLDNSFDILDELLDSKEKKLVI